MKQEPVILSADQVKKLQEELADLKGPKREELAKRLKKAIEDGDLSENADYIKAKEDQSFIEGRIQDIEAILGNYKDKADIVLKPGEVNIGSVVTLKIGDDDPEVYEIVGNQEADPFSNKISNSCPIGTAIFLKHQGETVKAETPRGEIKIKIVKVKNK